LTVDGRDLPATLLAAAQARNITHLVIGRAQVPLWRQLLGRTLSYQLLRRAPDFVLHVVPLPNVAPRKPAAARARPRWLPWSAPVVLVAAITGSGLLLHDYVPVEAADMVYLAAVVGCAAWWGSGPALLAAALGVAAWDFFFIPPLYQVTIDRPRDLLTAAVFAAVALLTGSLAGRARQEARAASARVEGLRRIGAFSRRLGAPATENELLGEIAAQAAEVAVRAVVLTGEGEVLSARASVPPQEQLDEGDWAAARWAFVHGEPAGQGTSTLPSAHWRFLPLRTVRGKLGVIGVRPDSELDSPRVQTLETLADQAAVALERVRLAGEAARVAAWEDTQRLRTALLASLGHDLRTPLTSIQGAAGTLRTAWDRIDDATRADLLASIEQDVGRMAGFLANLTDLTRLETGQIKPRLATVSLRKVVDAAVARLANSLFVAVHVPEEILVWADASLLEQAVFNILDNAMKYAPEGSLVRIAAEQERATVRLTVTDDGLGIPPEHLPHVFDSFFRVSRGDRTAAGTGLGLAISRGLLEAMGGRIAAQSPRPDSSSTGFPGTVMTITLPMAPAAGGSGS
jgi:two-component system sensor histidine kinase KdpD